MCPPPDVNYGTSLIALVRKHCYANWCFFIERFKSKCWMIYLVHEITLLERGRENNIFYICSVDTCLSFYRWLWGYCHDLRLISVYCPSSLPYEPVELDKKQGFQIINMVNFKHDIPTFGLRDQCSSCFWHIGQYLMECVCVGGGS